MNQVRITFSSLSKAYNRVVLFKNITGTVSTGVSLAITGPNGSGKSTLLKIIAGLVHPDRGSVVCVMNDITGGPEAIAEYISFSSLQVNPYEDLTGRENINFIGHRGRHSENIASLIDVLNLTAHLEKKVRAYSSGMRQRLRLIMAFAGDLPVLLLDEPGTSLDASGRHALMDRLETIRAQTAIIIATNDPDEEQFCTTGINLGI